MILLLKSTLLKYCYIAFSGVLNSTHIGILFHLKNCETPYKIENFQNYDVILNAQAFFSLNRNFFLSSYIHRKFQYRLNFVDYV